MRKFIIDTDTASDDAAALMLATLSPEIELLGVTTVAGNVNVQQATLNALKTLEVCNSTAAVYMGAAQPLLHTRKETISVHGKDGMGDLDLIHPVRTAEQKHAVDYILDTVRQYPDEVEIAVLGPATNIALAVQTDPNTMRKVKHIWSMGTPGFGAGNATPVAEFNVYMDPQAYAVLLNIGVPITIIGFDQCSGEIALDKAKLEALTHGAAPARFLERITSELLQFKLRTSGLYLVDLPDAIALAVALWPDFTARAVPCYCYCCTEPGHTYGQVIMYRSDRVYESMPQLPVCNATVIEAVHEPIFTERFLTRMMQG